MMDVYGAGQRSLQDKFGTRRLADRLEEVTYHDTISDDEKQMVEAARFFFLATIGEDGFPDVSYKGGVPGFIRCVSSTELWFPNYDGNGQFRSLGNITTNAHVSLLFIDFEQQGRLRLQGRAELGKGPDGEFGVGITIARIWPNCPRYIHQMQFVELSPYAPRADYEPPEAEWKQYFTEYLPSQDPR